MLALHTSFAWSAGRISADIGRLDNLRQLDLSGNQLTGSVLVRSAWLV